jgi:hypothetical protein
MDIENLDTHIKRISSVTGYGLNIEERWGGGAEGVGCS